MSIIDMCISDNWYTLVIGTLRYMPHWTPPTKDNIVYVTIDEALSGNLADIEVYPIKLERELHIGKEGYPSKVIIAGDQQTYALMKDTQNRCPDHYLWMLVLYGNWHMLQLTAEMFRDILWDGAETAIV